MVGWHHRLNGHEFQQILGDINDREGWCTVVCRKNSALVHVCPMAYMGHI